MLASLSTLWSWPLLIPSGVPPQLCLLSVLLSRGPPSFRSVFQALLPSFLFFLMLGVKARVSHILDKHSTPVVHPQFPHHLVSPLLPPPPSNGFASFPWVCLSCHLWLLTTKVPQNFPNLCCLGFLSPALGSLGRGRDRGRGRGRQEVVANCPGSIVLQAGAGRAWPLQTVPELGGAV